MKGWCAQEYELSKVRVVCFVYVTLNLGESTSGGTGITISTLFAVERGLN
jgi:hypothetical protein